VSIFANVFTYRQRGREFLLLLIQKGNHYETVARLLLLMLVLCFRLNCLIDSFFLFVCFRGWAVSFSLSLSLCYPLPDFFIGFPDDITHTHTQKNTFCCLFSSVISQPKELIIQITTVNKKIINDDNNNSIKYINQYAI